MLSQLIARLQELFAPSVEGGSLSLQQFTNLFEKNSHEVDDFLVKKGWERAKDPEYPVAWAYGRRLSRTLVITSQNPTPAWIKINGNGKGRVLVYEIPSLNRFNIIRQSMVKAGMVRTRHESDDTRVADSYIGDVFVIELHTIIDAGEFTSANKYVLYVRRK